MIALFLAHAAQLPVPLNVEVLCDFRTQSRVSEAQYAIAQVENDRAGYSLMRETVENDNGYPSFTALWARDGQRAQVSRGAHGVDAFYFASLEMTSQDYRMVDLTVGVVKDAPYFSALWTKGRPIQQSVSYWTSEAELRRKLKQHGQQVVAIAPYQIGTVNYFAALYDVSDGAMSSAAVGLTASKLEKYDARWRSRGYSLRRVVSQPGHMGRFNAVWQRAERLSTCEREIGRMKPVTEPKR